MNCPKCHKPVGDNDNVCPNCGLVLKEDEPKAKKSLFSSKSKKKEGNKKDSPKKEKTELSFLKKPQKGELGSSTIKPSKPAAEKIRFIAIVAAAVLIVLVVIIVVIKVSSTTGEKTAQSIAEYMNKPLTTAQDKLGIHLKDESGFDGVNYSMSFNYIYESEDDVEVDEVRYPEWAVTVDVDEDDDIIGVTYTDFTVLKKNYKGIKTDNKIDIGKYESGTKLRDILKDLDLDPYSINTTIIGKTYVFKYYYIADNGDAKRVIITAHFDSEDKLDYMTSSDVYPTDM